uniref:BPI2 domain-containing protein n=1 Tax=Angiostrongylus cantonensis TaxID=6313 RepID=A0A0K0CWF4_ANGCA
MRPINSEKTSAILLFLLVAVVAETLSRQFDQHPDWNQVPGSAGVKIRLTKKGINHVKTVGVRLLNEQITQLSGYSTQFPISQPGAEGFVTLSDVSVVNFLPPHFIVFGLEDMDIWLSGAFYGSGGPIQVEGFVDGYIVGMTVALTTQFTSTHDGMMRVQVPNCSTVIGHSHFNINPQGPMGPLVKTLELKPIILIFYGLINEGIRHRIPGMFCKKLKHLIEENSPRLFKKLVRTEFQENFKDFSVIDSPVIKNGMYIDNRHIHNPVVTNEYIESYQRGEIRYHNNHEPTPFYPKPIYTHTDSDRMLYFYGSDYLFNSLLYHAYQTNKLSIKVC